MGKKEELVVTIKLGHLNNICNSRGVRLIPERDARDSIERFDLGKRSEQQKFYSPKEKKFVAKGCVMLRRELFPEDIIIHNSQGFVSIYFLYFFSIPLYFPKWFTNAL